MRGGTPSKGSGLSPTPSFSTVDQVCGGKVPPPFPRVKVAEGERGNPGTTVLRLPETQLAPGRTSDNGPPLEGKIYKVRDGREPVETTRSSRGSTQDDPRPSFPFSPSRVLVGVVDLPTKTLRVTSPPDDHEGVLSVVFPFPSRQT